MARVFVVLGVLFMLVKPIAALMAGSMDDFRDDGPYTWSLIGGFACVILGFASMAIFDEKKGNKGGGDGC